MEKKARGWDYFLLALIAFGGLGMEVLYMSFLEPGLFGFPAAASEWASGQHIFHWVLTCITWGSISWYVVYDAKKSCGFDVFAIRQKLKNWQWAAILVCIVVALTNSYLSWDGFKVIKEFESRGALLFVVQYIYYAFETVLFLLIIVFGQKAGEVWFRKENLPYGGIVCGLTWGLVHALTRGSLLMGVIGMFFGFLLGVAYLLTGRDIRKSYPILLVMFIF